MGPRPASGAGQPAPAAVEMLRSICNHALHLHGYENTWISSAAGDQISFTTDENALVPSGRPRSAGTGARLSAHEIVSTLTATTPADRPQFSPASELCHIRAQAAHPGTRSG